MDRACWRLIEWKLAATPGAAAGAAPHTGAGWSGKSSGSMYSLSLFSLLNCAL